MANLFQLSLVRALDDNGDPINGALMNVYLVGTTTPAPVYSDNSGSTPLPNPVVSDADGLFPPVYLDGGLFRIRLTDATGDEILYDVDGISATGGGGGVGGASDKAAAAEGSYAAGVMAVQTLGYYSSGDLGAALYRRKTVSPGTAPSYSSLGWFQSADGAYWEIAEPVLNPFMFGAKGDDTGSNGSGTNDAASFNAMFRYMEAKTRACPVQLCGGKFAINTTVNLPRLGDGDEYQPIVEIDGGGARLRTNSDITIFGGVPTNQAQAATWIDGNRYTIRDITFFGTQTFNNQIGIHLAASYLADVSACTFAALSYGFIGTFCLEGKFSTLQAVGCTKVGLMLQTGAGMFSGAVWPDAGETTSASNVSTFENCRVFGRAGATCSFGVFGSDDVKLAHCVSEGGNNGYDVYYDYQGSPTCKRFRAEGLHCEAENSTVNFRIRASGTVEIVDLVRSYPAQIFDATNSAGLSIHVDGLTYLGNLPAGAWFTSASPGFGASGNYYSFVRCSDVGAVTSFFDPAKWTGGVLPDHIHVEENTASNAGIRERTRGGRSFEGVSIAGQTVMPSGGDNTVRLLFSSVADFGIYAGSGAPTLNAAKGSLYLRSDGTSTSTRAYISLGSGSWTAITTAS